MQKSSLRLLDLVEESAALLDVLAEEKIKAIVVDGDPSVTIQADRLILCQALINLIDNAVEYSPTGAKIRVEVHGADGNAVVEVRDSGPGIPPEHAEEVFERFYRVDKARSRAEGGAGLELSIVHWSVSAHGGKVDLDREAASGCAFMIHLPLEHKQRPLQKEG